MAYPSLSDSVSVVILPVAVLPVFHTQLIDAGYSGYQQTRMVI